MVIVRVKHFSQFFRVDTLLLCAQEIAIVKFGQIKWMSMGRLPQTQRLRDVITIPQHRQIPGLAGNHERRFPGAAFADLTADPNLHIQLFVMTEPRVAATPPVIRRFNLLAICERLTEQTILIIQAIAGCRLANGRHGVEETCRQTAQTAVAEARINLFFQQIGQVNVMSLQLIAHPLIPTQIQQVVAGQTTDQKLHRDIVDVTLPFGGFRHRLSGQQLGKRTAYGVPPLTLGHLRSGL